jgi:hypothetical protein
MGMFIQKPIETYNEMEIKKKAATLVVFTVKAELPGSGSDMTKPVILPTLLTVWAH